VNNQEAKILVGAREAYITQTLSTAQTATTTAESIEYVDVGVKLSVTPTISRDGFVTMKIKPEVSSVREYLTTKLGSRVPIVITSEAETVVKVKDGAMIMIGGLTKRKELESSSRTPILAKIPLLGLLFSKKEIGSDEPKSSELVVFITPRIITGDTPAIKETKSPEYVLQKQPKGLKEE
jgi:type II secretory pathway component GspD/PulD (secretin)